MVTVLDVVQPLLVRVAKTVYVVVLEGLNVMLLPAIVAPVVGVML